MEKSQHGFAVVLRSRCMAAWKLHLCVIGLLLAPMMAAADSARFNIPAQPLPTALKAFAEQAHVQLLYQSTSVTGETGNSVVGELETRAALRRLLWNTGLEVIYVSDSAVTIRRARLEHTSLDLQTGVAGPQQVTSRPSAPASSRRSSDDLYEVVVTATRREESVQSIPGQVTATTARDLDRINAHSLIDFSAYVPGLSIAPSVGTIVAIRGVTTGSQLSSAVGLYLDDIPIGSSSSFGLGYQSFPFHVFDLDRVEILNGPQGTLYGANSLGGTLKYITARPDPHAFSAKALTEISYTENGSINNTVAGMINLPFGPGMGALRLDALSEDDAGFINDPIYHRDGQGTTRTHAGRISLLLTPSSDVDVRLTGLIQSAPADGIGAGFRDPLTRQPTLGTYDQAYPLSQPLHSNLDLYSALVNWRLPWATFTSISGYQVVHGTGRTDQSLSYDAIFSQFGGGFDPWQLLVDTNTRRFTQELRLVSSQSDHFQWLAGAYYDHESTDELAAVLDAATAAGTFFGIPVLDDSLPSTYREYAGYADGTFVFTPKASLTLGVRYSQQHQTYRETTTGLLATGSGMVFTSPEATSSQNVVTYLINPKYQLTSHTMLYARAASGFRPGGPNFVLAAGLSNPTFAPDKLWNYEVGEKSLFLDNKALLNFDLYDIEWHGVQVNVNTGGVNQLENAGNARIKGAELAFNYQFLPNLSLGGSAAYTDAHLITPAPSLGLTSSGARLPSSPRYNFAVVGNYQFNITGDYSGGLTITDRYVGARTDGFGTLISPRYPLGAFNQTDADLSLSMPRGIQVTLYLKNVFNSVGELSAITGANEYNPTAPVPVVLSQPRTVGLVLKADLYRP